MKRSEMFYRGAEHGVDAGINACFGGSKMPVPYFETNDEEFDYWEGYEIGYASVVDCWKPLIDRRHIEGG